MTVPDDAIFEEEIALGIALYDVSHLLPTLDWKQRYRDVENIDTVFVHHSGALGAAGFKGLLGSSRYMVGKRKFPSCGYTYWISYEEERDSEGRLVIYRASEDRERDWHSGGKANDRGVAVCLQGNTNTKPLSFSHEECLEALIPWLIERHNFNMPEALSWHSAAADRGGRAKKQCPGANAESWLKGYRKGFVTLAPNTP